jgi:L-ribulose-5-phosphate 3-epimerase
MKRREFIEMGVTLTAAVSLVNFTGCKPSKKEGKMNKTLFKISLAEWSLNPEIFGGYVQKYGYEDFFKTLTADPDGMLSRGNMTNLDFPARARKYGIEAVEYVNTCFFNKAKDEKYLNELKNRCNNEGIYSNLIMCDAEGNIGDPVEAERTRTIENHYKWVDAAKFLGCRSIRVNARSQGSEEEQKKLVVDGLTRLAQYAEKDGINILVENHGGVSSNGKWLADVMKTVNRSNVGTLPDFGNFQLEYDPKTFKATREYDRYLGVQELMPYAKAVSAKTNDFSPDGNEIRIDYLKMMKIVLDAGYTDYVGVEFEGPNFTPEQGILKTKALLEKVSEQLKDQYK